MSDFKERVTTSGLNCMPSGACEPMSNPTPMVEKTEIIKKRLSDVLSNAESIYGELYGFAPTECGDDGNQQRNSIDQTLSDINRLVGQLEGCLSETLVRMRG
jgi:hypothetical protein